jgi:hypothetical protein
VPIYRRLVIRFHRKKWFNSKRNRTKKKRTGNAHINLAWKFFFFFINCSAFYLSPVCIVVCHAAQTLCFFNIKIFKFLFRNSFLLNKKELSSSCIITEFNSRSKYNIHLKKLELKDPRARPLRVYHCHFKIL